MTNHIKAGNMTYRELLSQVSEIEAMQQHKSIHAHLNRSKINGFLQDNAHHIRKVSGDIQRINKEFCKCDENGKVYFRKKLRFGWKPNFINEPEMLAGKKHDDYANALNELLSQKINVII